MVAGNSHLTHGGNLKNAFSQKIPMDGLLHFVFSHAFAQDIPEGTVLKADNVEELKSKTFEGKK